MKIEITVGQALSPLERKILSELLMEPPTAAEAAHIHAKLKDAKKPEPEPEPEPEEEPEEAPAPKPASKPAPKDGGKRVRRTKEQIIEARQLEAEGFSYDEVRDYQIDGIPLPGRQDAAKDDAEDAAEDLLGRATEDDDDEDDRPLTTEDAIAAATKVMAAGRAGDVKKALATLGFGKVSELPGDKSIRKFISLIQG